jgi:hypothetical protein
VAGCAGRASKPLDAIACVENRGRGCIVHACVSTRCVVWRATAVGSKRSFSGHAAPSPPPPRPRPWATTASHQARLRLRWPSSADKPRRGLRSDRMFAATFETRISFMRGHARTATRAAPRLPLTRDQFCIAACTPARPAVGDRHPRERRHAAEPDHAPEMHRFGPEWTSWPSTLNGNPYQCPQIGP